jgi:hypothetical protein
VDEQKSNQKTTNLAKRVKEVFMSLEALCFSFSKKYKEGNGKMLEATAEYDNIDRGYLAKFYEFFNREDRSKE